MQPCTPPLNVLIVEDEALLAMDIEMMVEDAGHNIVGEAGSLREFEALVPSAIPQIAFVDLQLAEGSSGLDVCARIRQRWSSAIIIFVTANPKKLPDDLGGGHAVISKPFSRSGLTSAMRYLQEGVCAPPPVSPRPSSMFALPSLAAIWGE
jgi:CheY-like chemotaxis protein